jgi:DNA repair photolyase
MYKEIQAKGILLQNRAPENWFGAKYTMNIYRGCEHQCIYCDSRSTCYQIEDFNDVEIKVNALTLLEQTLRSKRKKAVIGTGSMSDPYTIAEKAYNLTGRALDIIASHGFGIHISTKSDLILRDIDILRKFKNRVSVAFTLTTVDDVLGKIIEPFAPLPSERLSAMNVLAHSGILVGVLLMPILPFIEDDENRVMGLLEQIALNGAAFCFSTTGMTCREGQREYFYEKLDEHFPGIKEQYIKRFGNSYSCPSPKSDMLKKLIRATTERYRLITDFKTWLARYPEHTMEQGRLFPV